MSIPFLAPINLNQNELQNARIQNLASDPTSPVTGQIWFNSSLGVLKLYDGTAARVVAELTNSLTQFSVPTGPLQLNAQNIQNLATPVNATDAATKAYVDSVAVGLDVKASVVAATTGAGTLSSSFASGQVIDGVTLATGNRILIKNQTSGSDNGIYIVGTGAPTRSSDANSSGNYISGAFVFVEAGTINGGGAFVVATQGTITPGTTAVTWVQFSNQLTYQAGSGLTLTGTTFTVNPINLASGVTGTLPIANGGTSATTAAAARAALGTVTKYTATIGDGSTTSIVVTHNLNTQAVLVSVAYTASPYQVVQVETQLTSANTITLVFAAAPASGALIVTVIG